MNNKSDKRHECEVYVTYVIDEILEHFGGRAGCSKVDGQPTEEIRNGALDWDEAIEIQVRRGVWVARSQVQWCDAASHVGFLENLASLQSGRWV